MMDDPVMLTLAGASVENIGAREDEPMWVQSTVLLSHAARSSGYQ